MDYTVPDFELPNRVENEQAYQQSEMTRPFGRNVQSQQSQLASEPTAQVRTDSHLGNDEIDAKFPHLIY